ncbi:hypothetical protein [Actinoplanes sp. NPDC051859]|uniref:hypothetical protein n=1 Tax=Actinoplanes sp. NPDC051859 TaxID=3363909 RepID=UPI0037B4F84D
MTDLVSPPAASPHYSVQAHAFHYPTHSIVWTVTIRNSPYCDPAGDHLHGRDGLDVYMECNPYLTRTAAEAAVADRVSEHAQYADVLGTIEVFRHREPDDVTTPAAADQPAGPDATISSGNRAATLATQLFEGDRLYVIAAGDSLYVFDKQWPAEQQYTVCIGANLDAEMWRLWPSRWEELRRHVITEGLSITIVDARSAHCLIPARGGAAAEAVRGADERDAAGDGATAPA